MATIVVRLDPHLLDNPDADIRYRFPNLLAERSGGVITRAGSAYVGEGPLLVLFLKASTLKPALDCVLDVLKNIRVLDNDLRLAAAVAVKSECGHEVIYPPDFAEPFLPAEQEA